MHYIEIVHKSYKNHTEIIQKSHRNHACTQTHRIGRFRPQHVTLWAKTSVSTHHTLSQVPSALFPFPTHQIGRFRPQRVTLWVKTCVFDSWPGWELNSCPPFEIGCFPPQLTSLWTKTFVFGSHRSLAALPSEILCVPLAVRENPPWLPHLSKYFVFIVSLSDCGRTCPFPISMRHPGCPTFGAPAQAFGCS